MSEQTEGRPTQPGRPEHGVTTGYQHNGRATHVVNGLGWPEWAGPTTGSTDDVGHLWPAGVSIERPTASGPDPGDEVQRQTLETERALRRLRARRAAEQTLRAESAVPMPAGVPLSALLAEPDEPVRYLIDQLWPVGGRVLLAAGAKSGKSTLVSNVVRTLVDGGRFLMRFDTVRRYLGTVAVIDTEMPRDMIRRWYRDQKIDNPTGMVVYPLRGSAVAFDVQDGPRRAEWAARLRGHGTRVLIVDCLNPVLSACNVDESSNAEVGPWLEAFARLLDEAGIGEALITHHMGHGTERSRGASKLLDWPDAVWSLVRPHEGDGMEGEAGPARYLSAIGRDVALAESLLTFDSVSRRLQLAGGNRHQARLTRAVPAVVDHVRSHSGCSVRELQNEITGDLARTDVRAAIKYAIKRGEICVHTQARGRMNHYVRSECAECA